MIKASPIQPDIVLVVMDDLWTGDLSPERTPNAYTLADESRVYTRCYSHPVCWQSRCSYTWGLYGRHLTPSIIEATGVTTGPEPIAGLPTLASLLRDAGYATCLVGKWHRGRFPGAPSGPLAFMGAPQDRGYQAWRSGVASNLGSWSAPWERIDDYAITQEPWYATVAQANAAMDWWSSAASPKFMEVALSAPHPPFHSPPSELLDGYEPDPSLSPARRNYERMIRSADWALGQIMTAVSGGAIFCMCSDNGAPLLPPGIPPGHGKATTFEQGIRVPLSIRSSHLPGYSDRLVHLVDVPATLLELAGVSAPSGWDGQSLIGPERPSCLSEAVMDVNGVDIWDRAAMTKTHKLRQAGLGAEELYDLVNDPNELSPLDVSDPANQTILDELRAVLAS